MWPGVCQSCVSTTFWKPRAILLMRGTISSPPLTARLPPGVKQFCTSTTMSAVSGPALILPWASARGMSETSGSEPAAARNERRERSCMAKLLATEIAGVPSLGRPRPRRKSRDRLGIATADGRGGSMALHLIKLCVGCDSIEDLAEWQAERLKIRRKAGEKKPQLFHRTFQTPKRRAELIDGGSLYWVIKGLVQVRQPLLDIGEGTKEDGTPG